MIGMWNKSVILTYAGMCFAILGFVLAAGGTDRSVNYVMACFMIAGVCDLFDGSVARRVKRNDEEKEFGIQLDSLVDVVSFITLPIVIFTMLGMTEVYHMILYMIYALCGVARLAYFNVVTADENEAVKYYTGLPVTYSALIFPLCYLIRYVVSGDAFRVLYSCIILAVSILYVLKIRVIKPKGAAYIFFGVLAIVMQILYLVIL